MLGLFIFQNVTAILIMRYVRSVPEESGFDSSVAVLLQEILKIVICTGALFGSCSLDH